MSVKSTFGVRAKMAEEETEPNENLDEVAAQAEAADPTEGGPAVAAAAASLTPKQRRQQTRGAKAAKTPVRSPTSPEERHEERVAERRTKAGARRTERARQRAKLRAAEHQPAVTAPREHVQGNQKTRQGIVVSDKADKTITVRIDVARRHRRYQKIVRTSATLHAHDERNDAHIGDTVVVRESRPLSRSKRWRLVEVVERAK
jgi:small subunit ribosomal protein S17